MLYLNNKRIILGIDGRCASGKSTLADKLAEKYNGSVIRMDHFFPHLDDNTNYGINIDVNRFENEIVNPILENKEFTYRVFNCKEQKFTENITVPKKNLLIIEGTYAMYPLFEKLYNIKIFADISKPKQKRRIIARDGKENYNIFKSKWIPMEELYIKEYSVIQRCDFIFNNGMLNIYKGEDL